MPDLAASPIRSSRRFFVASSVAEFLPKYVPQSRLQQKMEEQLLVVPGEVEQETRMTTRDPRTN